MILNPVVEVPNQWRAIEHYIHSGSLSVLDANGTQVEHTNQSSWNAQIVSHYGDSMSLTSDNQWKTITDIQGMSGTYLGFVTPEFDIGNTIEVRVTIDGAIHFQKAFTATSNNWAVVKSSLLSFYTPKKCNIIGSADGAMRGMGEPFKDSLKIEFRRDTGSGNNIYPTTMYHLEQF